MKKNTAWKEVAEMAAVSGEPMWLVQLACYANMPMKLIQRLAGKINLITRFINANFIKVVNI